MRQLSPPRKPNRYSNYQNNEQQSKGSYLETMGHAQIVVQNQQMIKTRQWNILNCRKFDPHSREDIKNHYDSDTPLPPGEMPDPHTDSKYQPTSNKLIEVKPANASNGLAKSGSRAENNSVSVAPAARFHSLPKGNPMPDRRIAPV